MGYQFIHLSGYARSAGAGKAGGHSIASIVAEAERHEGACPHVEVPQPPILIFGCMPTEAAQAAAEWAASARDSRDHILRKDGLCLAAGVITWPENRPEAEWTAFRDSSIKWLQDKYRERLLSVVEHQDEPHPHIHFYAIPRPGERFEILHPGRAAAAEAKAAGLLKGVQNRAYKYAMRAWQSDFHKEVSQNHGLTRLGPRIRRKSRAEWKAEQVEAERQAKELNRIKRSGELVDLASSNFAAATKMAEAEGQSLAQERRELQKIIATVRQESAARAKQIQSQAAKTFQGGMDSRRRQKEWQRQRPALIHALPAGLTYLQIERRQEFFKKWRWLEDPSDVLRRTVESSRQNAPVLQRILNRQSRAWKAERVADAQAREARERLDSLKPLQLLEKARFSGKLREAEKALAEARADQKRFAVEEKKLLQSCPPEVLAKYQHGQEVDREKALAALLRSEAEEIEEERRREAAEAGTRAERMAMHSAPAKEKKPGGGWVPPSLN